MIEPVRRITKYDRILSVIFIGALMALVLASGCVSRQNAEKNETSAPFSVQTVAPAPMQLYIKAGQSRQFSYWGNDITVNYSSAYPMQSIKVTADGTEKFFQKKAIESPAGIYWKEGNLSFTLKPVSWETRDGQEVPIYESTWNTTEIYFEVQVILSSSATGGQER